MRSRSRRSTPAWICRAITDRALKFATFLLCVAPLGWLGYAIAGELAVPGSRLGADPGEAVVLHLGSWSLRLLLATLTLSTLRRVTGQARILRVRRLVGLFAFAYVVLHFLAYLGYLAEFDWTLVSEDLTERTYITAGFAALVLLIPLAVTSTDGFRRRLGARWRSLHRLIYPIAALALLHLFWLTKDGYAEPLVYALWYAALMLERMRSFRLRRS